MCLAALEGVGGDSRGFVFLFIFRSKARAGLRVLQVPLGLCIRSASSVWSVVRCTAQRIGGLKIRYVIQIRIEGMTGQLFSGGCRRRYDKARLAHLNVTKTSPGTQQRHIRINRVSPVSLPTFISLVIRFYNISSHLLRL